MGPKELAERYAQKNADKVAEMAKLQAQEKARQDAFQRRAEQGRTAMREVVIPYFKEVQAAFPTGRFQFNPAVMVETRTKEATSVWFKIEHEHVIEVNQGHIRIYKHRPQAALPARGARGARNIRGVNPVFVYASTAEPFIAEPSDLIREKLDKLVEMAIDEK